MYVFNPFNYLFNNNVLVGIVVYSLCEQRGR
jgi:hypothetical protein